jgi:hypothetical protein
MKISIGAQIEEVEREIKKRGEVYPRMVARGDMRQSVADMHIERMTGVLTTLRWLQENEAKVRAAIGGNTDA